MYTMATGCKARSTETAIICIQMVTYTADSIKMTGRMASGSSRDGKIACMLGRGWMGRGMAMGSRCIATGGCTAGSSRKIGDMGMELWFGRMAVGTQVCGAWMGCTAGESWSCLKTMLDRLALTAWTGTTEKAQLQTANSFGATADQRNWQASSTEKG